MDSKLSWFEQIALDHRARLDIRRHAVERVVLLEGGSCLYRPSPKNETANGRRAGDRVVLTGSGKASAVTDSDPNAILSSLYSPFIGHELSCFDRERDQRLGRKKVRIWLLDGSFAKVRNRMSFPLGIARIDSQINRFKMDINLLAEEYSERLADLDRRRKHYEQTGELHMVQMCVNRARATRSEYAEKTNGYYTGITELLDQKLELLNGMRGWLQDRRSRRYHRIRHYVGRVCTHRPALGPENMPDEVLDRFANTSIFGDYESVLNDTLSHQKHYHEEFNAVKNWRV